MEIPRTTSLVDRRGADVVNALTNYFCDATFHFSADNV